MPNSKQPSLKRLESSLAGPGDLLEFSFENLAGADRLVVTNNLNVRLKVIEDAEQIAGVLRFVQSHRKGWEAPPEGVPVARLRLNFYQGDRPLGNIGVGARFLTAHQRGGFYSKASNESQRAKVLRLVGLDDPDAP